MMADSTLLNMLVTWGGTFVAGAFGVGVGYATIREQLKSFKTEFENYKSNVHSEYENYKQSSQSAIVAAHNIANSELNYVRERVAKIEAKTEFQVGIPRCNEMRADCEDRITGQLKALSVQVLENKETVVNYMNAIQKFVGRVELFMERYGKP